MGNRTVGILAEIYNKWERRVPLTPSHCKTLTESGNKVVVQPSNHRIFTNDEYAAAGATINEDLTDCCLVLGVKQPSLNTIRSSTEKSYLFFSHTVKGQPENMELLQTIKQQNHRLFDYELIVDESTGIRTVAFGKFAGMAGMCDVLQAYGQRLLSSGYSTPFLNIPMTYMSRDLPTMKSQVALAGDAIKQGATKGNHHVFCFTGGMGNVSTGAQQIFEELPHRYVSVEELHDLRKNPDQWDDKIVYGVVCYENDIVRKKGAAEGDVVNVDDYRKYPGNYESIFASSVAPHINVLVNGIYWDERYPRLLTNNEMASLWNRDGGCHLMAIGDVSCDIGGSIEFMSRSTSIESPFYSYDPVSQRSVDDINDQGVAILAVDILPSELPKESSEHFGNNLVPLVEELVDDAGSRGVCNDELLSDELLNACIAAKGKLTPKYKYIDVFTKEWKVAKGRKSLVDPVRILELEGHLFDSGLINNVLDLLEAENVDVEMVKCEILGREKIKDSPQSVGSRLPSSAVFKITHESPNKLNEITNKISILTELLTVAEANVVVSGEREGEMEADERKAMLAKVTDQRQKRVLVLGAGKVAKSCSEYLGGGDRSKALHHVTVASNIKSEVDLVASAAVDSEGVVFDVLNDDKKLNGLISKSDCVVSLLPATMHPHVAEFCIENGTNLVTASYVSPEIQALDERCKDAGITILNEVGVDPGMDHMSAMKIMDDIKERGGRVSSFSSVCGGLPAPEAANNPLMYKFSWSPRGVITASNNGATYLQDGENVVVAGEEMLDHARPLSYNPWQTLRIECLPNRDSTIYKDIYGIKDADSIFRGTLRYGGFSKIMYGFKKLGLMNEEECGSTDWAGVIRGLVERKGYKNIGECIQKEGE